MGQNVFVTSFYRFLSLNAEELVRRQTDLRNFLLSNEMLGLILLAPEGVNGTVAGSAEAVESFKRMLGLDLHRDDISFKDSWCEVMPFHRITVDIRNEIVGMKRPDLIPESATNRHLSPQEWHERITFDEPKIIIDTRNSFETSLGKFKGAVDPNLSKFSDWGRYLDQAELPNDIPIYLYCTGGIRCEKAILEMQIRGHENVYQLKDGILGYIEEFPQGEFEGECFVFDGRVAVDCNLQPSTKHGICPNCGLTSDNKQSCSVCESQFVVCQGCRSNWPQVCSKTCRDLFERHGVAAHKHMPRPITTVDPQ